MYIFNYSIKELIFFYAITKQTKCTKNIIISFKFLTVLIKLPICNYKIKNKSLIVILI